MGGASASVDARMTGFMDVWWVFDLFPSNGLMLLLPYLLQQHRAWSQCATRLFVVATPTTDLNKLKALIKTLVAAGGIVAQVCRSMSVCKKLQHAPHAAAAAWPFACALLTGSKVTALCLCQIDTFYSCVNFGCLGWCGRWNASTWTPTRRRASRPPLKRARRPRASWRGSRSARR